MGRTCQNRERKPEQDPVGSRALSLCILFTSACNRHPHDWRWKFLRGTCVSPARQKAVLVLAKFTDWLWSSGCHPSGALLCPAASSSQPGSGELLSPAHSSPRSVPSCGHRYIALLSVSTWIWNFPASCFLCPAGSSHIPLDIKNTPKECEGTHCDGKRFSTALAVCKILSCLRDMRHAITFLNLSYVNEINFWKRLRNSSWNRGKLWYKFYEVKDVSWTLISLKLEKLYLTVNCVLSFIPFFGLFWKKEKRLVNFSSNIYSSLLWQTQKGKLWNMMRS